MRISLQRISALALWAGLYTAAALLLAWARAGERIWLTAAAVVTLACLVLFVTQRVRLSARVVLQTVLIFLFAGLIAASAVAWRLHALARDWDRLQTARHALTRQTLDRRLAVLLDQGRSAATAAAQLAENPEEIFTQLDELQRRSNVDALAILGEDAVFRAWAGEHRGKVPDSVRTSRHAVWFQEGPLYSYLYFTAPMRTGGTALAAVLLDAALPEDESQPGVAAQIEQLAARGSSFLPGPGTLNDWHLVVDGDTLLHVRLGVVTQAEWRRDLLRLAQRIVICIVVFALIFLSFGWFREEARPRRAPAVLPLIGTAAALFVAPLGSALGVEPVFSPGLFLLPVPGPLDVSLGSLFVLLLTAALFASTVRLRARYRSGLWFIGLALLLAIVIAPAVQLLIGPTPKWERLRAPTLNLLQSGGALWAGLQFTLVLLLSIANSFVLMFARWPGRIAVTGRRRAAFALVGGAAALAATLAVAAILWVRRHESLSAHYSHAWLVPLLLAGYGIALYQHEGRRILRWLTAGWLAATLVLPFVWTAHVAARLRSADRELKTLGSLTDPYLNHVLRQFGQEAIARRERGEDGLQLLYRTWVTSGLASEAVPARIMLWDAQRTPEIQLAFGAASTSMTEPLETVPSYLTSMFERVQELAHPEVFNITDIRNVNLLLMVPLDRGRVITVELEPRRTLERTGVIAALLGTRTELSTQLELVPLSTTPRQGWRATEEGWQSDAPVRFPEGDFHAHMRVRIPRIGVQIARGALLIAADLIVLALLWLTGRGLRGEMVVPAGGWSSWVFTFRGRVTAALFAFFLLPTVVFGLVAYRALSREVTRAAQMVAERAVYLAVIELGSTGADLRELSAHSGTEILTYLQGELLNVSSPELLELGVYSAWVPADVWLNLQRGETEADVAVRRIGDQRFLTAYRRMHVARTGIMAVPVSLQSGETIVRQRELAHLILFAAMLGGILSLALSVAVGRALAGPIGRLQRAAASIGAGRLRVRLPEQTGDEFGQLFSSFNRMVRRLQRARTQELRTARVLAWGEMARQVAHEIKNPLTPIKLSVQHLRRAYADGRSDFGEVLDRSVDQILIEIDRLTEIARAFSRYGAPPESAGPLEPVNVAAVVNEALTLYRTGDAELNYVDQIEPALPAVLSRPGELKEVILNLIENARIATEPGGRIAVLAHRLDGAVELQVQDTGVGVPAELQERIFEPHFSTRTTGTGLGLPIVRRLVESWGGTVTAESEAGRGTTIRVRLLIAAFAAD